VNPTHGRTAKGVHSFVGLGELLDRHIGKLVHSKGGLTIVSLIQFLDTLKIGAENLEAQLVLLQRGVRLAVLCLKRLKLYR
jgi:hypothetical protein